MNSRYVCVLLVCAVLAVAPLRQASAQQDHPRSSLSDLLRRISDYINSDPVQKAPVSAAVAAVRGGIPTDQGENLDQRLLDRAGDLRQRLLSASERKQAQQLRAIYRALAFSQWAQALELNSRSEVSQEISSSFKDLSATKPALPDPLRSLLTGPTEAINDKALVATGWGQYVRDLTPVLSGEAPATDLLAPPQTARLDEVLRGLQESWTRKALPKQQEAEAHFLAGQVYVQLMSAKFAGVAAAKASASAPAASRAPVAPRVVAAQAAEPQGAAGQEFNPRAIYAKASPAVVLIVCSDKDGGGELGSGSLLDASGRILTNAHVVIRDSTRKPWPLVRVFFKPAKMTGDPQQDMVNPTEAEVLQWDPSLDLALIRAKKVAAQPATLSLGDPDSVSVGDRVAAIGHPEQGGLWTLTTGIVSSLVANLGNVSGKKGFQTDASINRGNSGGPLVDASGNVVGVNTLMSRKAADGLAITGVNYAVRSDVARDWLAQKAGLTLAFAGAAAAAPMVAQAAPAAAAPVAPAAAAKPVAEIPAAAQPIAAAQNTPTPMSVLPAQLPMADRSLPPPPATMREGVSPTKRVAATPAPKAAAKAPAQTATDAKHQTVTESQPFDRDAVIQAQIKEMEDLGEEMQKEIEQRERR